MKTDEWPPCIVTAFDLIGTRVSAPNGVASSRMLQMHRFAVEKINDGMPNHNHGYVWNDSVLLLTYSTKPATLRRSVLIELSEFKFALEQWCGAQTYAISVQGLAFPQSSLVSPLVFQGNNTDQPRTVVLKTSSWAMANCFAIEKALKKKSADWYIDSRITKGLRLPSPFASEEIELLPKNKRRVINMYKGYFHEAAD